MKQAKIAKYKKKIVEDFARLIKEYPIIAAVDMENLPAPQLQKMRGQLREMIVLKMAKRRLISIAIEQAKKDKSEIGKIEPYLTGMPALLFTKENPFKLYKILGKSKSSAPAKAGQIAPFDLIIPAGPTAFAPGPIIGELGMLGIKTSVEGGKIAVVSDSVVVKEGEVITPKVAELLTRFNIKPMEIGLNITAVYEDGTIYKRDVLTIDEAAFLEKLQKAHAGAFNLAVEAGYYTKEVVETIIPKAFNEAKALAKEANIMCDLLAGELVETAERQALNLKAKANIPDEPVQAKVEKVEKKIEETKQEIKKIEEKKQEEEKEVSETKDVSEHDQKSPISEKKKEKIKEEVKKIEEEIKEEVKKPEPSEEKIEKIEKEVEVLEKEITQKEPYLPKQAKEEIDKVEQELEKPKEKKPTADEFAAKLDTTDTKQKQEHVESESMFEELKKKGTLRDVKEETKTEKPKENLSPQEIIEQHKKKLGGDES